MLLNPNKTEAVLFGTCVQRKKIDTSAGIDVTGSLHWVPVKQHIDYNIAVITFKAQYIGVPAYLASLVDNYVPIRTLRSADQFLLCSPTVKLVCSREAFSVNAPFVFNSIP